MTRHKVQSLAYLLYSRDYKDNSLLIDIFSLDDGKIRLIAKSKKKTGLLPCFVRLELEYIYKQQLSILCETIELPTTFTLKGKSLYCAYYLNELLLHLLPEHEPHPAIFQLYQQTLEQLSYQQVFEPILRRFELNLLNELGYAVDWQTTCELSQVVKEEKNYIYVHEQGIFLADSYLLVQHSPVISGKALLAMAKMNFNEAHLMQQIKQLMRYVLAQYLEHRTLKSREIYRQMYID